MIGRNYDFYNLYLSSYTHWYLQEINYKYGIRFGSRPKLNHSLKVRENIIISCKNKCMFSLFVRDYVELCRSKDNSSSERFALGQFFLWYHTTINLKPVTYLDLIKNKMLWIWESDNASLSVQGTEGKLNNLQKYFLSNCKYLLKAQLNIKKQPSFYWFGNHRYFKLKLDKISV